MTLPFVEKYRPTVFSELEGNKEVISCLKAISESKIIPNMLLYGPPGTGKTTSIRIISKNLPNTSVLELNASDERGINVVRQTIKEFASTYSKSIKLVILDEVDFMTKDAQNALRRIMEDYSSTTRFCLIANYPRKIISPILSRCSKFRFSPINKFRDSVLNICKQENIEMEKDGLEYLIKSSYGDMRKVINDIQAMSKSFDVINKHNILKFNGMMCQEEFRDLYEKLLRNTYEEIKMEFEIIKKVKSVDLLSILNNISEFVVESDLVNKMEILKEMSEIEWRLNLGCNEEIQMNGLISIFILLRCEKV